jgi:phage gpG-like protein
MVSVNVQITGDKELINKFHRFKGNLKDFSSEMDHLGKYFVLFFGRDVFATEGDVFGERWRRLSKNYEFWKRINFAGRGILEKTGELKKGYKTQLGRDFVKIYNDVDYAKYHHFGTNRLPKRTLVKIDEQRKQYIVNLLRQSVAKKIGSTFK